eukprot:gnl/Dysnectes_brevis/2550_a3069_1980.p1 GENE.gnl/Dysnectes_brevis/2550_a3069_1980~~gnl/Dysnectes_brevis/2550_a3069_1980.p1  ORF type:complete len:100 (+),score=18.62 gnl/Dysnectes_brevis/2550_a3069_1980:184-483(+)
MVSTALDFSACVVPGSTGLFLSCCPFEGNDDVDYSLLKIILVHAHTGQVLVKGVEVGLEQKGHQLLGVVDLHGLTEQCVIVRFLVQNVVVYEKEIFLSS